MLYPDWMVRVYLDSETYKGFKPFWDSVPFQIEVCNGAELTKAMLWRMKPAFDNNVKMFICRDTDSPLTYRERQAVYQWEKSTKSAHAITDSVSHNIYMLGGMIGFKNDSFRNFVPYSNWDEMVDNKGIDYNVKGADQDFLNRIVYPRFSGANNSIMQHYFLGMRNTFIDGYLTCNCRADDGTYHKEGCVLDIEVPNIPIELKETNNFAGHIGAAGWYEPPMFKYFNNCLDKFDDIRNAELKLNGLLNWKI